MSQFLQDLRFGARTLTNTPGFTALAIASLALGVMAVTAMYSVIHAVVLDPFPYKDVGSLMSVRVWGPEQRGYRTNYSTDQFLEIAERNTIFDGVIASTISDVLWTGDGDPQRLRGNYGPPNTFMVMGVPALVGRYYTPADGGPDAAPVVVLGYRFWQRQFGGDVSIVGRQMKLNDRVRTVVGVMPKRFMWRGADVYLPIVFERGKTVEGVRNVHVLGRLKSGVTDAQAEADLRPIIADLVKKDPQQFPPTWRVGLLSFEETFPSSIREDLWILFGAVGLLLLIACANVSNLLLSKAAARQREMAVRAALGGSRARLVRQLLTESLLLAIAGGAAGTLMAYGALRIILTLVPPDTIPDESEIALNMPVLVFSLIVSAATSVIFGLAPALHACTRDLAQSLRASGRGLTGGGAQALLRKGLVVGAVALSIMLMVGASLMIRTVLAINDVKLGFRPDRVLTLRVPLSEQKYPEPIRRFLFFDDLMRRIATVPGVTAVAVNTTAHPFGNVGWPIEVPGAPANDQPIVMHQISADYTKALGIAVLKGRTIAPSEVEARRQVALVNRAFERTRFEGDAVGRIVRIPRLMNAPIFARDDLVEIVGVVNDTLNRGLTDAVLPEIYIPYSLLGSANRVVVQTGGEPASVQRAIVEKVYGLDPDQPVTDVRTIGSFLNDYFYAGPRFNVVLLSVFAALGLTLAVVGVYGVMSHAVSQQTREIGVRIALGAEPRAVARMIVKSGAILLGAGIVLGLAGSMVSARLLEQQIWHVSPFDPISFAAVSVLLLAVGLQACAWPAWRASRTPPTVALRAE